MKFTAIKENLTSGLNIVQRALSSKAMQPILGGIYLSCQNNTLTLIATDNSENAGMRIQCKVPVEVLEEGNTVVNGKSFRDFVSRLPDTKLMFYNESRNGQDKMEITYDKNKSEMIGWPGYEFPEEPPIQIEHMFTISAATLSDVVRQTGFAVKKDDLRPIFTGLYFEVKGNDLTVVGTDSFRLTVMETKISNEANTETGVIIPIRALQEVIAIADEDATIHISLTKNLVIFEMDQVQLIHQLIKGDYPAYRNLIPKNHSTFFTINRALFKQSLERATLFSRHDAGSPRVRLLIGAGKIEIKTASEIGHVDEEIDIYLEGDSVNILFNVSFLLDAFSKLHYDELEVTMSGDLGPCIMRPKNDNRYLYLLLPLRQ